MKARQLQGSIVLRLVAVMGMAAVPFGAPAATTTFTGGGMWTNPTLWSAGVPQNGDDAVVAGNATTDVSTAVLASYVINAGYTNTFAATNTYLQATNITINGTMTHLPNTATTTNALGQWVPDNLLRLTAYSNVTVNAGGKIDADYKGYQGATNANGYGPGAGTVGVSFGGGGGYGGRGGYGGQGGNGSTGAGGGTYGSSNAPVDPGSGGAMGNAGGGMGGGLVRLQVTEQATINGTISANGGNGVDSYWVGGGGSGGGVSISCKRLQGAGIIQAKGGNASGLEVGAAGGGGGGRIAIWRVRDYWSGPPFDTNLVSGGAPVNGGGNGAPGTVVLGWLPAPGTVFSIR